MYIGVCLCAANLLSDSAPRRQAARVRLPEERPEGGVRKWKAAEFSPGLRCKRETGSLVSARPRESSERPPPAGLAHSSLRAPPKTGGEDSRPGSARGLEWMPGIDLQPGSAAAGELDSRGGQSTEFPFLGVLMEENAAPGRSVRPRSQRALGTPPAWVAQLGQLPPALPKKMVQAGNGTSLPAGHRALRPPGNFISLDDIFARCGHPWGLTPLSESPGQRGSPGATNGTSASKLHPARVGGWGRGNRSWLQGQCAALGCACSHVPGVEGQPGCGGGGML